MEANTVILNLEEYNELRDFKTDIEKNHTIKIGYGLNFYELSYITRDEAVKQAMEIIEEKNKRINQLESECLDLKHQTKNNAKSSMPWMFRILCKK